jgi:hypothetical protein
MMNLASLIAMPVLRPFPRRYRGVPATARTIRSAAGDVMAGYRQLFVDHYQTLKEQPQNGVFPAVRAGQIMLVGTCHQGMAMRKFHTSV